MKRNSIDRFIYSITKKPAHYVEVRNPPKTERYFRKKQRNKNRTEKVYYNEHGEKTSQSNFDHHIFR